MDTTSASDLGKMQLVTSILQIVGSLILALNIEYSWIAYWIMIVGCYTGMRASMAMIGAMPLFVMWAFFFVVNLVGIYRWTPW